MTWKQALALAVAMGVTVFVAPARADDGYPPPQYDIGGGTEAEVIVNYIDRFGNNAPPLIRAMFGQAKAECDAITLKKWGVPYPASATADGSTLTGCLVRNWDNTDPVIVYSFQPWSPEFGVRLLRHEIGHLLGWGADHRRD